MSVDTAVDIPRELDDLSPEWLVAAIGGDHPGAKISSVRSEALHQGTGSTWRLHLDHAPGSADAPKTLIIKSDFGLDPTHAAHLAATGLYRKEAIAYLDILPGTSARTAKCYAAAYDDKSGRAYMLLQDIAAAGGHFCDPVSSLTPAQVAVGLEELAKLHAARWDSPSVDDVLWKHHGVTLCEPDPIWEGVFNRWETGLKNPHAGAVPQIFHDRDLVRTAFNRARALEDPGVRTLIHGDAHIANFFVDRDGNPGMADFQCVQRGHVAHDVTTFIVTSLDILDRREHEQDLVRHYLRYLQGLGVDAQDFDEVWLTYRRHLIYSYVSWLFTTAEYQPQIDCVTNLFRFGMAAIDLDTLGAINS